MAVAVRERGSCAAFSVATDWTAIRLQIRCRRSCALTPVRAALRLGSEVRSNLPPMKWRRAGPAPGPCWRKQLAAHQLRTSDTSLVRIAEHVGYESEAAFNRAFKRHFGVPPAAWRQKASTLQAE